MNDEIQPQPIPDQPQIVTPVKTRCGRKAILDGLPIEVRNEIDNYIRTKNPVEACKYIKNKYTAQYPQLSKITKGAFYTYSKKHSVKTTVSSEVQSLVLHTPPDPAMKAAIMTVTDDNVSLTDKRAALLKIYQDIYDAIQTLKATQVNFADPQMQQVITNKEKVLIDIIKHMEDITEKQARDSDKDWLVEADVLMTILLSAVKNTYKIEHQEDQSKFHSFMSKLEENLNKLLKEHYCKISEENSIREELNTP